MTRSICPRDLEQRLVTPMRHLSCGPGSSQHTVNTRQNARSYLALASIIKSPEYMKAWTIKTAPHTSLTTGSLNMIHHRKQLTWVNMQFPYRGGYRGQPPQVAEMSAAIAMPQCGVIRALRGDDQATRGDEATGTTGPVLRKRTAVPLRHMQQVDVFLQQAAQTSDDRILRRWGDRRLRTTGGEPIGPFSICPRSVNENDHRRNGDSAGCTERKRNITFVTCR
jgi:hypothetical protein